MFKGCGALFRTAEPEAILAHMKGQTITHIVGLAEGSERVVITCESGDKFAFWHSSDCCESVSITQVDGDVADLIGSPLLMSEQVSSEGVPGQEEYHDSFTWTFYKFATAKGYVTVRWYGESNGCYSEEVAVACLLAGHNEAVGHYRSGLDKED